jgi:hypothetical protein
VLQTNVEISRRGGMDPMMDRGKRDPLEMRARRVYGGGVG